MLERKFELLRNSSKMSIKIIVSYVVFIMTFLGSNLSAIVQNSVNEDSENNTPQTNLETESKDSNSATISTSASSLGGPSTVDSEQR